MDGMKSIGLVGGVASGKSRAAQMLLELGAGLLDADRAGHAILVTDPHVRHAIRERWGEDVFAADGSVDRAAVAGRVFKSDNEGFADREFLEDLLHPRIRRRLEAERREMVAAGRLAVVLDAPLLLEAGWGPMCDVVLMVDAERETRLARARKRGWSEAQFDEREAAQWPIVKKRQAADVVIHNDGTEDELRRSVCDFWNRYIVPGSPIAGPGT
jgi:dephospho-CoA kinase